MFFQILVGQSNGQISCFYSPEHSLNGAKLLANKAHVKKATIESMAAAELQPTIITPHALPMFRDGEEGRSMKRKREKERLDPRKSKRPDLPVTGPGRGGRVGASATQHVVQNLFRDTTRDEDVSGFFRFDVLTEVKYGAKRVGASTQSTVGAAWFCKKTYPFLFGAPPIVVCFASAIYAITLTKRLRLSDCTHHHFLSATDYHSVLTATCCSLAKHY